MATPTLLKVLTPAQIRTMERAFPNLVKQSRADPKQVQMARLATAVTSDLLAKGFLTNSDTDSCVKLIHRQYATMSRGSMSLSLARSHAINLAQYCGWNRADVAVLANIWGFQVYDRPGIVTEFDLKLPE